MIETYSYLDHEYMHYISLYLYIITELRENLKIIFYLVQGIIGSLHKFLKICFSVFTYQI